MPTPFRDGDVDQAAIRGNVRRWMASGLGGIVALGTNGEAPLLDEDESVRVVEAARVEVPSDRVLIAGAGHESTRATIAAAGRLAMAGADAVLVKTPYTYRNHVSAAGLIAHYTAVADASPVPVLLYNFPASTGVNLAPETVAALAGHPNIAGMKETSTDGAQFADLVGGGAEPTSPSFAAPRRASSPRSARARKARSSRSPRSCRRSACSSSRASARAATTRRARSSTRSRRWRAP